MTELTRVLLVALALSSSTVLLGCNTIRGAGEDVEATGEGVQNAAEETEEKIEEET
jgi:predicted small secreted protein